MSWLHPKATHQHACPNKCNCMTHLTHACPSLFCLFYMKARQLPAMLALTHTSTHVNIPFVVQILRLLHVGNTP